MRLFRWNRKYGKRRTSWNADDTFLTRRADLADVWVVDLGGTSTALKLFMRTLQGQVNRSLARLYLVNSDHEYFGDAERFWIEEYARRGWVNVAGDLTVDEAIKMFGPEISGYVTATEAEPWSVHAATVISILRGGVVAPDAVARRLKDLRWEELDTTCGRWADAVSAFTQMVDEHRSELAYPGIALVHPNENLWDFVIQQQIMPVYSRPKHDTWEGVAAIMDSYPGGHILYGYVSDDTVEEEIAVERASSSGKYLVPTHEVSNLSVHSAVLATSPVRPVERTKRRLAKLDPTQVNVAIAITDGDNLHIPIHQYPLADFWNTDERGSMPLGWSMGVSLSTLAPGIWEFYRTTASSEDEIVSIMGIAYVHASTLPEPGKYFSDTFASMTDMGLHTLWSLDSSLTITDEDLWDVLENARMRDVLKGVVVGYGPSIDKAFRRATGTPVMITQNGYSEDAERLKQRIEEIMALEPSERSPVNFLMATNWSTNARDLYTTLKPLEERGVRFLTPSEALALMPDIKGLAKSAVDTAAEPGMYVPFGPMRKFGSPILSAPTLAEVNKPLPGLVSVEVTGPEEMRSGETAVLRATVTIDTNAIAADFLHNRVLPVVEGYGLSDEFAESAWMKLEASSLNLTLPFSDNVTVGDVEVSSSGAQVTAGGMSGSVQIVVDAFTADSRTQGLVVQAQVSVEVSDWGETLQVGPESVTMEFALTVGIGKEKGPLVGGVRGQMGGVGARVLYQS
jgi:hypothetical protein